MLPIRPRDEIERLRATLEEIQECLDTLPRATLLESRPKISRWSVAQHFHHLGLVNDWTLERIEKMRRQNELVEPGGRLTWIGRMVLATGWIPRGKGRAPGSVRPPVAVDIGQVETMIASSVRRLESIRSHADELASTPGRVHHAVFGHLDACQWLRFTRVHTRHHLRIARDVLALADAERPS